MALTPIGLVFLGLLAVLCSLGLFINFRDEEGEPDDITRLILTFLAAVLWAMFGLSSYNVRINDAVEPVYETFDAFIWVGFGLSFITGLFALWFLFQVFSSEAEKTDLDTVFQ